MKTKLKDVLKSLNVLLFTSEIFNPLRTLLLIVTSFILANSKIDYLSINIPLMYKSFLKYLLKYFLLCFAVFILFQNIVRKKFIKSTILISAVLSFYIMKFAEMSFLVALFFLTSLYILKPSGINLFIIPSVLAFFLGIQNSPPSWIDLETKMFFILPYAILSLQTDRRSWSELSSIILLCFLFFVSRPIGIFSGLTFLISKRISSIFPKLRFIFSAFLPFLGFSFGYIFFIEFQRGIPIGEPFIFLSKVHIPAILSAIYPSLALILYSIRSIKSRKKNA